MKPERKLTVEDANISCHPIISGMTFRLSTQHRVVAMGFFAYSPYVPFFANIWLYKTIPHWLNRIIISLWLKSRLFSLCF
ncbi:MAG: Hypothetical protein AJITA_00815 [Acetilactobacillus jinshanensis]